MNGLWTVYERSTNGLRTVRNGLWTVFERSMNGLSWPFVARSWPFVARSWPFICRSWPFIYRSYHSWPFERFTNGQERSTTVRNGLQTVRNGTWTVNGRQFFLRPFRSVEPFRQKNRSTVQKPFRSAPFRSVPRPLQKRPTKLSMLRCTSCERTYSAVIKPNDSLNIQAPSKSNVQILW